MRATCTLLVCMLGTARAEPAPTEPLRAALRSGDAEAIGAMAARRLLYIDGEGERFVSHGVVATVVTKLIAQASRIQASTAAFEPIAAPKQLARRLPHRKRLRWYALVIDHLEYDYRLAVTAAFDGHRLVSLSWSLQSGPL